MFCRFHWLLAIIDPYEELGIKGRKNINWKVVKCPLQEGTVECGYYVMKYMKEIIDDSNCSIITKFKEKAIYTQQEINALRIE
ncbi:unnamed protein product [Malus baccata var. baccata]